MKRYEVSASQWRWMEGFLPGRLGSVRGPLKTTDSWAMAFCGCCAAWSNGKICPPNTATGRVSTGASPAGPGLDCGSKSSECCWKTSDNTYSMIDSTIVWAHQQAASGKGGARTRLWGVPEAARAPRFACWLAPREGLCALPSLVGSNSLLTIDNAGEYEILATGDGARRLTRFMSRLRLRPEITLDRSRSSIQPC